MWLITVMSARELFSWLLHVFLFLEYCVGGSVPNDRTDRLNEARVGQCFVNCAATVRWAAWNFLCAC